MARRFFMSLLLLLLSMPWMASDPPGDLHVRLVSRDREAAVVELRGDAGGARRLEIAQLVFDRRFQRPRFDRQAHGGVAASVRPYLAVIRDAVHRGQGGRPAVGEQLGPDWHDWP